MAEKGIITALRQIYSAMLTGACAKDGGLIPAAFILEHNNQVTAALLSFNSNNERTAAMALLDEQLEELKAEGLVLFMEMWAVRTSASSFEEARRLRKSMPRNLEDVPGRIECLVGTLITHGWSEVRRSRMIRTEGKLTFEKEVIMEGDNTFREHLKYFRK